MRVVGLFLIALTFLGGSYFAVLPPDVLPVSADDAKRVPWGPVGGMLVLGAVGVALARIGGRQVTRQEGALTANMEILSSSIERVVKNIAQLDEEKDSMHPYDLHGRIDELFREDLALFADSRESIGHVHGLQAYAEVMNHFAAGERYLNRVWSASVDCYIEDAHEYIGRAEEQFVKTQQALIRLRNNS